MVKLFNFQVTRFANNIRFVVINLQLDLKTMRATKIHLTQVLFEATQGDRKQEILSASIGNSRCL